MSSTKIEPNGHIEDEEAIVSARTELARGGTISPPTEPRFSGDARDAAAALIKQVDRLARTMVDAAQEASAVTPAMQRMQRELDAAVGVARVLERCIGPRIHHLKTDPEPFADVKAGRKRYEVRRFDRDFRVGDRLVLTEFDRTTKKYSGDNLVVVVVHILPPGAYGMPEDVGVMGIELLANAVAA